MHTRNVNVKTATEESSRKMGEFCPEPKTASLIALYGDEVSYAWNVLEDLKVAGASIPGETLSPICFVVWALNNFFKEIAMIRLSSRYAAPTSIRRNRPLTDDELMRVVPSAFSVEKHESRSDRYTYIPTIALLDRLRNEGFQPYYASQSRVRNP
jgi:hypothetical protein